MVFACFASGAGEGGGGTGMGWNMEEGKGERVRATLGRESSVPPFHARLRGKTHSSMSSIKLDFCALARFRSSLVNAFRVEGMHVDVQASVLLGVYEG